MSLPRALQPWSTLLGLFPPELAAAVGDLVARLSVLLGPLARVATATEGEPDGVAGIGRRGSFDRLIATDWALLHEVPEEFLRRAAERELSYFEIARIDPAADRRCVALFDEGGAQLGAPRIVHLALLVLLAQRATDAGASFAWGVLQEDGLVEEVTKSSATRLLRARRQEPVRDADLERWGKALAAEKGERELWVIGGPRTPDPAPEIPHARIVVDDPLDPSRPNALAVAVHAPRTPVRSLALDVPADARGVRLLRNPFAMDRPERGAVVTPGTITLPWVLRDRALMVRSEGNVLVLRTAQSGPVRAFRPADDEEVLAFGWSRRKAYVLLRKWNRMLVGALGKRAHLSGGLSPVIAEVPQIRGPVTWFPLGPTDSMLLASRMLHRLHHPGAETKSASLPVVPARAAFADGDRVRVVTAEENARLVRVRMSLGALEADTLCDVPGVMKGGAVVFSDDAFACEIEPALYAFYRGITRMGTREHLPEERVVGLHTREETLVVIDAGKQAIVEIHRTGQRRTCFETHAPIVAAEVDQDFIVTLLEDGSLETRRIASGELATRYVFTGIA